jgi:hypothetical protein
VYERPRTLKQPMEDGMTEFSAQFRRAIVGEIQKLRAECETLRDQASETERRAQKLRDDAATADRRATELEELLGTAPQLPLIQKNELGGARLRELAIKVLARRRGLNKPIHYREWFELLAEEGHKVGGKDPLASFLTQLSRSPLVAKDSSRNGVYHLRTGDALEELQADLQKARSELARAVRGIDASVNTNPPADQLEGLLGLKRSLESRIGGLERKIAEAKRTLDQVAA